MIDWPEAVTLCIWGICAAFYFYSKDKHEESMKELDLEDRELKLKERMVGESPDA